MKGIQEDVGLELQVIVTGMHLSPEFGLTWRVIEEDGFPIDSKVEMLLSSDSAVGIAKSIGLGVIGFADALDQLRPDLLLVLGDRFEILAAVQAALVARIPVAHIAGGDTTEGAFDEAIRHSITKMSHLHFVTNHVAARRVRQLGEDPRTIHLVGSPGLDQIKWLALLDRDQLARELDFTFCRRNLLVTYHPVTLDAGSSDIQFRALLDALDALGPDVGIIFTKPNADTGGRIIINMIDAFVTSRSHARVYTSLGQLRYLSVLAQVDVIVGNSSSGLYEAPTLKKPTVNIGDRQKGRLQADSVLNCPASSKEIEQTIRQSFNHDCSMTVNPYGDGESSPRIVSILREVEFAGLLKKHFFDAGSEDA
jgi:UDP-N-acetylglucosamine 2-epimerase (non-hydrolysing)/GDP/UDP-N,N'-diacetylbacillosamine 2-epimerase (hydrolysing)